MPQSGGAITPSQPASSKSEVYTAEGGKMSEFGSREGPTAPTMFITCLLQLSLALQMLSGRIVPTDVVFAIHQEGQRTITLQREYVCIGVEAQIELPTTQCPPRERRSCLSSLNLLLNHQIWLSQTQLPYQKTGQKYKRLSNLALPWSSNKSADAIGIPYFHLGNSPTQSTSASAGWATARHSKALMP